MSWEGAAISAGGNVLGSVLGFIGGQQANAANNRFAWSQLGFQNQLAQQQLAWQREAAQNGIRWRVADAKAAGISPLVAMGAQPFNTSPVQIGVEGPQQVNPYGEAAASLRALGQDVSRAVHSTMSAEERRQVMVREASDQQALKRGELQNQILETELASRRARLQAVGVGPPMPSPGATAGGAYTVKPAEVVSPDVSGPNAEAGPGTPYAAWQRTNTGVIAKPTDQNMDHSILNPDYAEWYWKNRITPYWSNQNAPNPDMAGKMFPGAIGWQYRSGEWQPVYPRGHWEHGRFVPR